MGKRRWRIEPAVHIDTSPESGNPLVADAGGAGFLIIRPDDRHSDPNPTSNPRQRRTTKSQPIASAAACLHLPSELKRRADQSEPAPSRRARPTENIERNGRDGTGNSNRERDIGQQRGGGVAACEWGRRQCKGQERRNRVDAGFQVWPQRCRAVAYQRRSKIIYSGNAQRAKTKFTGVCRLKSAFL